MATSQKKKKVLVVEDRENWRTTFCNLLDNLGYKALQATCGNDFMAKAPKADVIILDISMPETPDGEEIKTAGLDALIKLQNDEKYKDHIAIQNPIIRSMWERTDFKGTKFEDVKVAKKRWLSRNVPTSEILALIESM